MGEQRSVLGVIRPVRENVVQPGFIPHEDLLHSINTGIFRITYGRKTRFLYATKPVVAILGCDNFRDLLSLYMESLFLNPFQYKAFSAALFSREIISASPFLLRRKSADALWVSVSVIVVENGSGEIWCEGTIEPIAAAFFRGNFQSADLHEYSANFIMRTPVSAIIIPPLSCPEYFPAYSAA